MRDGLADRLHWSHTQSLAHKQLQGLLNKHQGEARTLSLLPEWWYRLEQPESILSGDDLGSSNYQFSVSPNTSEELFSGCYGVSECSPNFDRPISTFIVEDIQDPTKFCVRSVPCCGLSELFLAACNSYSFDTILKTWMEGRIVARDLQKRGQKKRKQQPLAAYSTSAETWTWTHQKYS